MYQQIKLDVQVCQQLLKVKFVCVGKSKKVSLGE